jgi:hypothetical protein
MHHRRAGSPTTTGATIRNRLRRSKSSILSVIALRGGTLGAVLLALMTAGACRGEPAAHPRAKPVVAGRGPAVVADRRPCARQRADAPGFFSAMTTNRTDGWITADLPASVDLRDGRVLWLFGDTWTGARAPDGGIPPGARLQHNSAFVQTGGCVDLVGSAGVGWLTIPGSYDFWWPAGGVVPGGTHGRVIDVFVTRVRRTGPGVFDFWVVGTDVVQLRRADLAVIGVQPLPHQERLWGSSVVADGGWLYLFGRDYTAGPSTYLARVRAGDLGGRWQFRSGRRWSRNPGRATPVITALPFNNANVARLEDGRWLAIAKDREFDGTTLIGWSAAAPQGPWRPTGPIVAAPTTGRPGEFTYLAASHPEIHLAGKRLLVSWNLNSRAADLDHLVDPVAATYGPRFAAIRIPRRGHR